MKNISTCLLLIALVSIPFCSFSKEKKEKEKKLSKKEMEAWIKSLDSTVTDMKQKIASLDSEKATLNSKVANLTRDNASAIAATDAAKGEVEILKKTAAEKAEKEAKDGPPTGLAFKVQVGAYKKFDISAYFEKAKSMSTEDIDGYKKYLVGYFDDLDKAQAFAKDMKKMGVKDSWIVPYKGGSRISDEEAGELLGHPLRAK